MNSLRTRMVLLLMIAIASVAVLAAFVTYTIIDRPMRGSFEQSFAEEVRIIAALVGGSVETARSVGLKIGTRPDADTLIVDHTFGINAVLAESGANGNAVVVGYGETGPRYLGFPVQGDIYAYLPYPLVPRSPLRPLAAYLTVVVIGSIAVSIIIANKIVSPLRMLEKAIASVGPDGELASIDEKGPAEVRVTARALNLLSQRLKSAMDSRMRLVAAAGHDLRTPMTRMRLRAEFLPPEEQETWLKDLAELDHIADSAIRLVREEVGGGVVEETAVRLDLLLIEIGMELREVGKFVDLAASEPVSVEGRPMALKRALRNLVDNAATHGGGATVRILHAGDDMLVEIDDEGPGIPDALLGRVFEPFFRVDVARRKTHPGAGLGFAIAKEILASVGGAIAIENRPGCGLRQRVTLRRTLV